MACVLDAKYVLCFRYLMAGDTRPVHIPLSFPSFLPTSSPAFLGPILQSSNFRSPDHLSSIYMRRVVTPAAKSE